MVSSYHLIDLLIKLTILLLFLLTKGNSVVFNFNRFEPNMPKIRFEKDAFVSDEVIQLTRNQVDASLGASYGRASHDDPVQLWDPSTKLLTDFTTSFSFVIDGRKQLWSADGLAFFIAPFDSVIPENSSGENLGLFTTESAKNSSSTGPIVAVEFDTFQNSWDPSPHHVGIDINSIVSVKTVTLNSSMIDGSRKGNASVSYSSASHNLSVFLTYAANTTQNTPGENVSLSYIVDLRKFLPEKVRVGFSAATGSGEQLNKILTWLFNSTLEISTNNTDTNSGAPSVEIPNPSLEANKGKRKGQKGLWIGLSVGFGILFCGLGLVWFMFWRNRVGRETEEEEEEDDYDISIDGELKGGSGPKRFTYSELSHATNNFSDEGKLGVGGFGVVYKGILSGSKIEVAVKRVSKGSSQGKKEYVSEVNIINRLRHRNLVQLIGWYHNKQGDFLLVYEYLHNGSLDSYLFGKKLILPWVVRHKIALGLASALLYLHEEWEQCVLHRDIKSSNIMLDSNFNAKLGDFGLAKLVDHDRDSDTTLVLAGTKGYMAPEFVSTGKASKESDVYSFGVVTLEICCGRRTILLNAEEPSQVRLVEWVWALYGKGQLVEAVDKGLLSMEFDDRQIECVMVVGLWCCHPDPTCRPSIKQVMSVLNFEAPLPNLPPKLPVPMYFVPPFNISSLDSYSSSVVTGSSTASSSTSTATFRPLLKFADP
ncbi:GPCR kinase [Parasponia andersonii]|uniref:non-specific serine/threonine protein kinase n=1 Tax=Parasponia andersonii TaxID=3476 RepID=A0A2P5D9B1_PARAD|nr:GPCR kinase [Parasponia andersonii]